MKKLTALIAIVLLFNFAAAAQSTAAEFKFEKEMHDFGKVTLGKSASYVFTFTNTGNEPLIINKVESTCGCTVPEYTQTPVKKGETGMVKITYTASGVALPFNKAITLTSNARTKTKVLVVKGESVEAN
jgi:hypothetical protein